MGHKGLLKCSSEFILSDEYVQVGTGLGPTLEFYTLVSRELQRSDLMLFRGDLCLVPESSSMGASTTFQYIHSPTGLFPAPLGPSSMSIIVDDVCAKFKFMGKLMAKAIMDSRMVSHTNSVYTLLCWNKC